MHPVLTPQQSHRRLRHPKLRRSPAPPPHPVRQPMRRDPTASLGAPIQAHLGPAPRLLPGRKRPSGPRPQSTRVWPRLPASHAPAFLADPPAARSGATWVPQSGPGRGREGAGTRHQEHTSTAGPGPRIYPTAVHKGRGFGFGKRKGQSFGLGATRRDPGRGRGLAAFGMRPGLRFGFLRAESGGGTTSFGFLRRQSGMSDPG